MRGSARFGLFEVLSRLDVVLSVLDSCFFLGTKQGMDGSDFRLCLVVFSDFV